MKRINKYISVLAVATGLSACQAFVKDFDVSPNQALKASIELRLTGMYSMSGLIYAGDIARTANIWAGVFTGVDRQYSTLNNYVTSAGDYNDVWSRIYHNIITQSRIISAEAAKNNDRFTQGKVQIMDAMTSGLVTSMWGDVPFSEAGNYDAFPNPKYDKQSTIYATIQLKLDSAITNLTNGPGRILADRDLFYGGANTKWVAAANTLKARFYLHTKNYQSAITAANKGIAQGNDMNFPFLGNTPALDWNPYYDFQEYNRAGYMDASDSYAVTLLASPQRNSGKTDESGRLNYFFMDNGGMYPNTQDGAPFAAKANFPLVSYVENQLILAEAYLRTGDATSALSALNRVRAYNASTYKTKYDAYTTADFSNNEALLKEIMTEKYLSLIGQLEEFNDVRRAKKLSGTGAVLDIPIRKGTKLPQRFLIPQDEINTNKNAPNPIPDLFAETEVNK